MTNEMSVKLRSGRSMPLLGLGTWQLNDDTAGTVEEALRLGYRMIDTSGDYGTQPGVGEAMRHTDLDREKIYLVTKVEEYDDAYEATGRNLSELGLEYADLMLIHRPPLTGAGRDLWEGLIRARDEGLARDIGVSNYSTDQMDELIRSTGETPAVNQVEWSPFGWSREMVDFCGERGIVIQAYSPLTRGRRLDDERLRSVAARHWQNAGPGTRPLERAAGRGSAAEGDPPRPPRREPRGARIRADRGRPGPAEQPQRAVFLARILALRLRPTKVPQLPCG
jgi:2,5-diketo-D-gluconate reductase A